MFYSNVFLFFCSKTFVTLIKFWLFCSLSWMMKRIYHLLHSPKGVILCIHSTSIYRPLSNPWVSGSYCGSIKFWGSIFNHHCPFLPDKENKEFNENIPRGGKGHFGGQILLFNQMLEVGDYKAKLNLQFFFVYRLMLIFIVKKRK